MDGFPYMINAQQVHAPLLWSASVRARVEETPRTVARIQDSVLQLYLSSATSRASETALQVTGDVAVATAAADQVTRTVLAPAVLGWPYKDGRGFEPFALDMIDSRLRSLNPPASSGNAGMVRHPPEVTLTAARLYAVPSPLPLPPPAIGQPGLGTHRAALPPPVGVPDRSPARPGKHLGVPVEAAHSVPRCRTERRCRPADRAVRLNVQRSDRCSLDHQRLVRRPPQNRQR